MTRWKDASQKRSQVNVSTLLKFRTTPVHVDAARRQMIGFSRVSRVMVNIRVSVTFRFSGANL